MKIPIILFADVDAFLSGAEVVRFRLELPKALVSFSDSDGCLGIELQDRLFEPTFSSGSILVFASPTSGRSPLEQTYLLRRPNNASLLCRIVRSEEEGRESYRSSRRKSFMTPTPLHIPTSKVSPIPSYTHASHFLKPLDSSPLIVVPTGQSVDLYPLVWVHRTPGNSTA